MRRTVGARGGPSFSDMQHAHDLRTAGSAPGSPLGLLDQVWRDARMRLVAASCVVLVHAAYPPGSRSLDAAPAAARTLEGLLFRTAVSWPVNAFVLLAFLGMASRLAVGAPGRKLLRTALRRLVPAHLFWVAAFLGARAVQERRLPDPWEVAKGVLLGTAAAHLYFVPLLLALMATALALRRVGGSALAAGLLAAAAAAVSASLELTLSRDTEWVRTLLGYLGFVPYALAGLALGRWWGGVAPGPERARVVAPIAAASVLASIGTLAWLFYGPGWPPDSPSLAAWLATNGLGLGVPLLILCAGGRPSSRFVLVARHTMGVYFVHPFFVVVLRRLEAGAHALRGLEVGLILPNAVLAAGLSFAVVALASRTRLRHMVG